MLNEIREGKTGRFHIEAILENLKKSEDRSINQLINGEISVDAYCSWLVGNGNENNMN